MLFWLPRLLLMSSWWEYPTTSIITIARPSSVLKTGPGKRERQQASGVLTAPNNLLAA